MKTEFHCANIIGKSIDFGETSTLELLWILMSERGDIRCVDPVDHGNSHGNGQIPRPNTRLSKNANS